MAAGVLQTVIQRNGVRQFVKFLIVGAGSTLIDFSIYLLLTEALHLERFVGSAQVARLVAATVAFGFAVTNGFFWNNRWTFRKAGEEGAHKRYAKFVTTNIIGLCLNLLILTAVAHLVPETMKALLASHLRDPAGFIGKVCATAVVVFWNFSASKWWTFKS